MSDTFFTQKNLSIISLLIYILYKIIYTDLIAKLRILNYKYILKYHQKIEIIFKYIKL